MSKVRPDLYVVLGLMLAVTVTVPTLSGGGFDGASRSAFVALAGVLLLAAGLIDPNRAARAARSPLAVTLLALAALSAASAVWTVAIPSDALRWGLVIGGYGAVVIASATIAERCGPWPIAAGIAVLAVAEAVIGLHAVAFHSLPDAERIVRAWQPGGTFEYPPALAILQVGALPILAVIADRERPVLAGAAAASLVLAGAVLRLADSRLALALAAVVLLALLVRPPAGRRPRQSAVAAALLVLAGGVVAPAILGGDVARGAPGAGATGLAQIIGLAVVAAVAWPVVRRWKLPSAAALGTRPRFAALAVVTAVLAASVVAITSAPAQPRAHPTPASALPGAPTSGVLHGRSDEWLAAIETWLDRPILGAGTGSYYVASSPHQTIARSLYAHNLPLELAAELGVLGLVLGVLLYVSAGRTIARALDDPAVWLVGPLVIAFLVSNLLDWTWHLAGLGAAWAAACGALTAAARWSPAVSR